MTEEELKDVKATLHEAARNDGAEAEQALARLCAALRDAMARAEKAEAAALSFQRACGCIDGPTLSAALRNIRHILREGDGIIPSPCEGIPDAAERVVKRAEKAEKLAAAERAYRVAEVAYTIAGHDESTARAAEGRWKTAAEAYEKTRAVLIEAGGEP